MDGTDPANFGLIIGSMVIAGTIGGYVNQLRAIDAAERAKDEDFSKKRSLAINLGLSLIAAFLIPLFLGMIESSLVSDITKETNNWLQSLLIFYGFCLVAALSSSAFINTISSRVLRMAEAAREDAQTAREVAERAEEDAAEAQAMLEEEEMTDREVSELVPAEENTVSEEESKIMNAMNAKPTVRRSISGIFGELRNQEGFKTKADVEILVGKLQDKGIVSAFSSKSGAGQRFKLSPKGVAATRKTN
ncbi:MAG: YEATS-associated helix-containing protein [Pseudomonadota bacterium]